MERIIAVCRIYRFLRSMSGWISTHMNLDVKIHPAPMCQMLRLSKVFFSTKRVTDCCVFFICALAFETSCEATADICNLKSRKKFNLQFLNLVFIRDYSISSTILGLCRLSFITLQKNAVKP